MNDWGAFAALHHIHAGFSPTPQTGQRKRFVVALQGRPNDLHADSNTSGCPILVSSKSLSKKRFRFQANLSLHAHLPNRTN